MAFRNGGDGLYLALRFSYTGGLIEWTNLSLMSVALGEILTPTNVI